METIKRIDIVICAPSTRIGALSAKLFGHELEIGKSLYTSAEAKALHQSQSAEGRSPRAMSDTGEAQFGRSGLSWTLLNDLVGDIIEQGFRLGWITRQQKAPINREIDVEVARRNGHGGSVLPGGKKQRRAHDGRPPLNDGKLRYSFVRDASVHGSDEGDSFELEAYLRSKPAQHCHVWLNPDGSATVNAVFSREPVTPRQLTDLLFDEKGFTALTCPNPEHPRRRPSSVRQSMADQLRAKLNGG